MDCGNQQHAGISCDLIIIGMGMAGMAAALFAAERHIDTVQIGATGELAFASGMMDLLGVHPLKSAQVVNTPWKGIDRLCLDEPQHPFARLPATSIRIAMATVLESLKRWGYPHLVDPLNNLAVITPVGTIKPTYAIPHTMARGPSALAEHAPCLLVDFHGLKGFSAQQIASSLEQRWPGLRPLRIAFPDATGELFPERMARALDLAANRARLIAAIRPHIKDAAVVALPAVLGIHNTLQAMQDMEQGLGVPVFEIPTMMPAATGLRLKERFEQHLPAMGIRTRYQQNVSGVRKLADGRWLLNGDHNGDPFEIKARAAVLCSGRFFGKGLHAGRHQIRETIFGLPVAQPRDRAAWHHKELFNRQGHPINRAGIVIDNEFRPVNENGQFVHANLFAAGSILAHQDWVRQKCGSGLAIATAYGAIEACKNLLES
jgi:glycerol-3-phosphate dehydrogenase subunit B